MRIDQQKLKQDALLTLELGKDQKTTYISTELTRLSDKVKRMTTTKNILVVVLERD